jgi:hypothetical protein
MISVPVAGLILSALGLITVFAVLFFLFYTVLKFLFSHKAIFGDTLPIRLIGLGITALLFSEGVTALILSPIQYVFGTVNNALNQFKMLTAGAQEGNLWTVLSDMAYTIVSDSYGAVYYYPVKQVLFALTFWIVFGQFFSTYRVQGENHSLFASLPDYVRKNILRISIFVVGIYLSLAAIIAIPWLQEEGNPDNEVKYNAETLRQALTKAKKENYDTLFLPKFPSDPIAMVKVKIPVELVSSAEQEIAFMDDLQGVLDEKLAIRQTLVTKWEQNKLKHNQELKGIVDDIVSKFEAEGESLKEKQRIKYFQKLREHFQSLIVRWNEELALQGDRIISEDQFCIQGLQAIRDDINNLESATDAKQINAIIRANLPAYLYDGIFGETSVLNSNINSLPSSPEAGDDWGIFSLLGSWLFRTDNMSLVLITGVIGFGLFGASISSFVRDFTSMKAGQPGKDFNVGEMIIRGISAAVVIFLAVEGGLSVFTQEKMNPNPHVLFFSCLVGAVFSEQIWNWAKDKLEDNFKTDEEGSGDPPQETTDTTNSTGENSTGENQDGANTGGTNETTNESEAGNEGK